MSFGSICLVLPQNVHSEWDWFISTPGALRIGTLGGMSPHSFSSEFFETFLRLFFPLNMIPWHSKQILFHCEEPGKFVFDVCHLFYANFMLPKPSRIHIFPIMNFYKRKWPPPYLIFVIFLHQHIFRPENFTLKSA